MYDCKICRAGCMGVGRRLRMIAHLPSPLGLTAWSNHPGQDILRHKCMYRHIQATENRISGVRPSCVTRSCIRRTHALVSTMSLDQKSPKPTRYQPSTYEHSQASDVHSQGSTLLTAWVFPGNQFTE